MDKKKKSLGFCVVSFIALKPVGPQIIIILFSISNMLVQSYRNLLFVQ